DESYSWYTTLDGVMLSHVNQSFFISSINKQGLLQPTRQLAHEAQQRSTAEQQLVKAQAPLKPLFLKEASHRLSKARATVTSKYFPHKGTPTALVILAQFTDTVFHMADPKASFEQFLNGGTPSDLGCGEARNYSSVKQYFSDMSNGQFVPNFKVVGPVTLPNPLKYYGADNGESRDINYTQFVTDACAEAAKITNFDDPALDSDNDGTIDLVSIIYAGFGQNNGAMNDALWAKMSFRNVGEFNGKNVNLNMIVHELNANEKQLKTVNPASNGSFSVPQIAGVGVFCHEFSHTLGLPDLYATIASANLNNQCMEYWSLMDGGEYVHNSYHPTAYTAWEREVMGWQTPQLLNTDGIYTLKTYANGGEAYKLQNSASDTDYLLFENIQKQGWNQYLSGHGLLVYHINANPASLSAIRPLNNVAGQPGVTVVPADGLLLNFATLTSGTSNEKLSIYRRAMAGDPFPGTSNVCTLMASQNLPNYLWRTEPSTIDAGLLDIDEDTEAGTVSFRFCTN
ncbi:MAG: M6 family metalloprotease domain-containing protein, partial [Prevotella sp.]|nr:M6 family metalloprotease domain-containing protein [Prevotella sp.]